MPTKLLLFWTGPLPHQELFPDRKINPLVHWVFHPVKRHLARIYLSLLQNFFGLKVIAITGSFGKTTTKDMFASVLPLGGPTVVSRGNITPTYNIPATIFQCRPNTRYLVLEMGVEYPGDMQFYTWLARPDIAIITSVNITHTELLGTVEDVAREKGAILHQLPQTGAAVINSDDPNILVHTSAPVLYYGSSPEGYTQIISSTLTPDLKTQIELSVQKQKLTATLPLVGTQFVSNAAAVATTAHFLGLRLQSIAYGLAQATPPPHRMAVVTLPSGTVLVDDTYNANPKAVSSSLDTLMELAKLTRKQPVFAFGQMNELGQYAQESHREIGEKIKKLGIKDLFTVGPATTLTLATTGYGHYFETTEELAGPLKSFLKPEHIVLLKASRSWHFETLVASLQRANPSNA